MKIKTSTALCGLILSGLLVTLAASANTTPVIIPNFSFESPVTTGATFINPWPGPGFAGVFISPGFGQGASPTDGNQIAFLNADFGRIFRTLTDTFQAGNDYMLSVDVSARSGPGTDSMRMVLYQGTISGPGDLNASNIIADATLSGASGVVADQFNTFSVTATPADISAAGAIGQPIGIGFFGLNSGSGTSDFDLDNVRLLACSVDSDGDGVFDDVDVCPDSIVSDTVVIEDCDSGVENIVFDDGCTLADLVQLCADEAKNHGDFVSCVAKLANGLKKGGVLSGKEAGKLTSCAAKSSTGK